MHFPNLVNLWNLTLQHIKCLNLNQVSVRELWMSVLVFNLRIRCNSWLQLTHHCLHWKTLNMKVIEERNHKCIKWTIRLLKISIIHYNWQISVAKQCQGLKCNNRLSILSMQEQLVKENCLMIKFPSLLID